MSRRPPSTERGFTLLECEIALIVLTLAILLLSRLVVSHELLVHDMERWVSADPVYYVVPREDAFERQLGHAAGIQTALPVGGGGGGGPVDHEVTVLSVTRTLYPASISVLVDWEAP